MKGYQHILVPLDGSECSERALIEAERLQEAFGARLTLLYVVSDPDFDCTMGNPTVASASVQRDCAEAEKYLFARFCGKRKRDIACDVFAEIKNGLS